jgi:sugar phosphate isomerase/epimerase
VKTQEQVAVTLAPLGSVQEGLEWVSASGIRGVQLSATQAGMRPRDLDVSARRDLRATLRRLELTCSGIDFWIPVEDWLEGATMERAVDAFRQACRMAEELHRAPLSLLVPGPQKESGRQARCADVLATMVQTANVHGVQLANLAWSTGDERMKAPYPPMGACIDPAAILASGRRPFPVVTGAAGAIVAARIVDLLRTGQRGPLNHEDGQLDVMEFRVALESAGCPGLPVIDARHWSEPRSGILQSLAAWQGVSQP